MVRALEKRPVQADDIETAIAHVKRDLLARGEREIESRYIGDLVMHELRKLDQVAYIRFASVYLSFEDLGAFREVIDRLEKEPTPEMRKHQISLLEIPESET
jgi:transcriptional repressor NrdR